MEEEKSVLRWGGLAGILGVIFFFLTIVIAATTLLPLVDDPEGVVMTFPDLRAALTLVEGLYVVGLILWVTLFLALYQALRGTNLTPALFGSAVGFVGLVVLAAGGLTVVAFAPISELYHAPGATSEEQATLVLLWQATQGIFNELDTVGLLLMTISFIVFGVAMLGAPAFGKGFGGASVVIGVVGVAGISFIAVDSLSSIALVGGFLGAILSLVIFPLLLGWKVYSLSRVP